MCGILSDLRFGRWLLEAAGWALRFCLGKIDVCVRG